MAAFVCNHMRVCVDYTSHQIHILHYPQIQTDQDALQSEKKTEGQIEQKFFIR